MLVSVHALRFGVVSPSTDELSVECCSHWRDGNGRKQVTFVQLLATSLNRHLQLNSKSADRLGQKNGRVPVTRGHGGSTECMKEVAETTQLSSLTPHARSEDGLQFLCAAGRLSQVMDVLETPGTWASKTLYAQVMRKCGQTKALAEAKRLHAHLVKRGLEADSYVGSGIVEMYVKCGDLVEAEGIHGRSLACNPFSWTVLISGYASCGQATEAIRVYEEMREEGVKASTYTFVHALKACSSLGDWETGKKLHAHVVEAGMDSDVYVRIALMDMYAKCRCMLEAGHLFHDFPQRNVVSWNVVILGYAQQEEGEEALKLYAQMQKEGVAPNERTFVAALKACGSLAALEEWAAVDGKLFKMGCLEKCRSIHCQILKSCFEPNAFVGNTLINAYAKCGSMVDAQHLFQKLPDRDVVSWNVMILGYAQKEEGEVALQLYARMLQDGHVPDDRTFVGTLKACGGLATLEEGTEIDGKIVKLVCLEKGRSIHSQLLKAGFDLDAFAGNTLIDMYAKCGSILDARHAFDMLPCPDVVSWNAMISGYADTGENDKAFEFYARMQEQGLSANNVTLASILKVCGNVASLEIGKEIHAQISKSVLEAGDPIVATAVIDMYGKCGSMADAQQVFDSLPARDVVTWNALIAGYARQGDSDMVFHLFGRMAQDGIQPDKFTFLSVLTVCSHAGLVHRGDEYFHAMRVQHGLTPTVGHYNCMVDLYGRAGQLNKAVALVENMSLPPDVIMWTTLLGACQKWGDVKVAKHAFERALRLDENHAAAYVLMSNVLADAQMWEDRDKIRALRDNLPLRKKPGQSWWTEAAGTVHTFVVGDTKHPQRENIYAKLKDLSVEMEERRFVKNVH